MRGAYHAGDGYGIGKQPFKVTLPESMGRGEIQRILFHEAHLRVNRQRGRAGIGDHLPPGVEDHGFCPASALVDGQKMVISPPGRKTSAFPGSNR